jgi:ribosome-associated protein
LTVVFPITTEYIKLDSFLKGVNAVCSGGEAKTVISEGAVLVNGIQEMRRGRKLYCGDRVEFGESRYMVERALSVAN